MTNRLVLGLLGSCAAVSFAAPALAQDSDGSYFRRDRNVSVQERPRPEYQVPPIQAGAFLYQPRLAIDADFTDNVFATENDEESDVILSIVPSLNMSTAWLRHALSGRASVNHREYLDFGDENVTDFDIGADGRLDFTSNTEVDGGLNYALLHEPRTSAGAANRSLEPIEYQALGAYVGAEREFGRTRFGGTFDIRSFDFDDGELLGGVEIDQDNRDREDYSLELRGDYALSPDTAIFTRARYLAREYDSVFDDASGDDFTRNSSGYTFDVGADFDLSNLVRGQVGVGYLTRSFDDNDLAEVDGLSVDGFLEWFATPLMTATFRAGRALQPSAIIGSGAYTGTAASAELDYELLDNVVLNGGLSYAEDDYEGIDRADERIGANFGGTYLLNRNVGVSANYYYSDQDSTGLAGQQDYSVNRFVVSLTLQR